MQSLLRADMPMKYIPKLETIKKIKSMAYSSRGSHTGHLDSATDWQMAVRRDNVISITVRQVY